MYSLWCREIFNHNKRLNNWCLSIIIAKVCINGLQFAICKQVLVVKEWPFVLFSKIAISNPSYFPLEMFSWLFLSIKWYTWRHFTSEKSFINHCMLYKCMLFIRKKCKNFALQKMQKSCLPPFFFCESTFLPQIWTTNTIYIIIFLLLMQV